MCAKMGRPTDYDPSVIPKVRELSKDGATLPEIADYIGVSLTSVNRWKAQHRDFRHAIKLGRAQADNRVVRSLYAKATGYTFDSERVFCNKDGEVTRVPVREHVPPSDTAAIFWLKNRQPDQWRESNATGSSISINISGALAERLVSKMTQGSAVLDSLNVTQTATNTGTVPSVE